MNIILIGAEFDIDKGSSISFKFPPEAKIDEDDQVLAELMLPEGSHLHHEDNTYFILNRKKAFRKNTTLDLKTRQLTMDATCFTFNQQWRPLHPSMLKIQLTGTILSINLQKSIEYELNGEMCIYSRSSLVYFPNTVPRLAIRFCSVDDRIYFTEYLNGIAKVHHSSDVFPEELEKLSNEYYDTTPILYTLNMVGTRQVAGARRGARVKSIAIGCPHPWVHVFKPVLLLALDEFFKAPSIDVIKKVYDAINTLSIPALPKLSFCEKKVARSFLRNKVAHYDEEFLGHIKAIELYNPQDKPLELLQEPLEHEISVSYAGVNLPLKIPTVSYDSEIGDFSLFTLMSILSTISISPQPAARSKNNVAFAWHPHLDLGPSTSPLLVLIFALLTEKRVLFVGHGKPCRDVGNCVLSCVAIASGGDLIDGVIDRCFPYASLGNVDELLKTNGYIAGVTNPVFEEQHAWWDLCINLTTNKMLVSNVLLKSVESLKPNNETQTVVSAEDEALIQEVFDGIKKHIDENYIRQVIYRYVERFVEMTLHCSPTTIQNLSPCWISRAEGWFATNTYKNLAKRGLKLRSTLFFHGDIQGMIQALLFPPPEITTELFIKIFFTIDAMVQSASDNGIIEILSFMTSSDGSCLPFSFGLFHERPEIYLSAARIILRLYIQKLGTIYCNPFVKFGLLNRLSPGVLRDLTKYASTRESGLVVNTQKVKDTEPTSPDLESRYSPAVKARIPAPVPAVQSSFSEIASPIQDQTNKQIQLQNELTSSLKEIKSSDESLSPSESFLDLYHTASKQIE